MEDFEQQQQHKNMDHIDQFINNKNNEVVHMVTKESDKGNYDMEEYEDSNQKYASGDDEEDDNCIMVDDHNDDEEEEDDELDQDEMEKYQGRGPGF